MYNDRTGIVSYLLQALHVLASGATLLETNGGIIAASVITDVWKTTPFMALLLLAGLQVIPGELYEAASVDGSSRFQCTRCDRSDYQCVLCLMAMKKQALSDAEARAFSAETRKGIEWRKVVRYLAVVLVVLVSVAPLYWTVATSVKSGIELNLSPPTLFPHSFSLENYASDFSSGIFTRDLVNSAIIATVTTILSLIVGILCAYAIARMKFRGVGIVLGVTLSVQMVPLIAMVGPLFVVFTGPIPIYNTYMALMTSFFRDLPPDLEEAALVDGATRLRTLWSVIMPLTAPGVFASAINERIAVWNDFLFGLTLTTDQNAQPVTVGVSRFAGEHTIPWGEIAAAAVIVTIPLVIVVLFLQKRIVSGLTAGAVKG